MDAFPLGPDRCLKKTTTHGICDLCWYYQGIRVAESNRHILLECPHSIPITTAHRLLLSCCTKPNAQHEAQGMDNQTFISTFTPRIIFGCTEFEPKQFHCPPEVVVTLTGAIQQRLFERRNNNARQMLNGTPPEASPTRLLSQILSQFALAAESSHAKAIQNENRHQIYYPDRQAKETPIDK